MGVQILYSKSIHKKTLARYMHDWAIQNPRSARKFYDYREKQKQFLAQKWENDQAWYKLVLMDPSMQSPQSPPVELAEDEQKTQ